MDLLEKYFGGDCKTDLNSNDFLNYVSGIMFISYLTKSIKETKKSYFTRENKYGISKINIPDINVIPSDEISLEKIELHTEDIVEDTRLYKFIIKLSPQQKHILYNYYIKKRSETDIGKELGVSKQAVNKMKKKLLKMAAEYKRGCL